MVLQRWQTVMLFLAFLFMAVFCFSPVASFTTAFLIFNIATAILLFINIFLYRNLRLQIRWATVILLLEAVSAGLSFAIEYTQPEMDFCFYGAPFTVVALVLTWFARRFMIKDRKLLAAADRIR